MTAITVKRLPGDAVACLFSEQGLGCVSGAVGTGRGRSLRVFQDPNEVTSSKVGTHRAGPKPW